MACVCRSSLHTALHAELAQEASIWVDRVPAVAQALGQLARSAAERTP
jgi:hypothetical protein